MATHATTAHYKATPEKLFQFISDIENLPKWATGFCKKIWKDSDDYKVETPMGEMYQRFEINQNLGTIDMYAGPTKDMMWCWPTRVTADNMGGSVFSFTCIQMPDQGDAEFEGQCLSLVEELENIRKHIDV